MVNITGFGWLVLVATLLGLHFGRRWLLAVTVASVPFFYATVAILPFAIIRPFHITAGGLIIWCLTDLVVRSPGPVRIGRLAALSFALLIVVGGSFLVPTLAPGLVNVVPEGTRYSQYGNTVPLELKISNITQTLYVLFGVGLTWAVGRSIRSRSDHLLVWRVSLYTGVVILSSVLVEYWLSAMGQTEIVNTIGSAIYRNPTVPERPYVFEAQQGGGLPGIRSIVGEPAYTSLYALFVAGLAYGGMLRNWHGNRVLRVPSGVVILLAVIVVLVSGSSTGLLGLVALILVASARRILLILGWLQKAGGVNWCQFGRLLWLGGGIAALSFVVVVGGKVTGVQIQIPETVGETCAFFINELQGQAGSGLIRLRTIEYSLREVFVESPVIGVGFGSHRVLSTWIALLANIGVIGTLVVVAILGTIMKRGWFVARQKINSSIVEVCASGFTIGVALMVTVGMSVQGLVMMVFAWPWVGLGVINGAFRYAVEEQGCHRVELKHVHSYGRR